LHSKKGDFLNLWSETGKKEIFMLKAFKGPSINQSKCYSMVARS